MPLLCCDVGLVSELCLTADCVLMDLASPAVSGTSVYANGYYSYKLKMKFGKFKVCKSVHHRTIEIDHQPDATIFQFIILTFIYSSTCFRRSPTHHQELNDCSSSLWFLPSYRGDSRAVFVAGPTTNTVRLSARYEGKNQRLLLQSLSS